MSRPAIRITYCADCGYDPQALALSRDLLREFGHELSSITLIPWTEGTFEVVIDGALAHSMAREGAFPEPAAICALVRAAIGSAG